MAWCASPSNNSCVPDRNAACGFQRPGETRIEGVAGGQFDLAIVTDSPTTIGKIARREMYIENLFDDHFVLAANPTANSAWSARWEQLAPGQSVVASEMVEFPFILPESDATRRGQFDDWCQRATGKSFDVVIEAGGWPTILGFVESGLGVGLVPRSAVELFQQRSRTKLSIRPLELAEFPAVAVRLIARKAHGREEPDLTDVGKTLVALLREQARIAGQ